MGNLRKEETVQAVLVADTYNENFQPFSAEGTPVGIIPYIVLLSLLMQISSFSVYVAIG